MNVFGFSFLVEHHEKTETRNVQPVKVGEKASSFRDENLESEYLAAGIPLADPAIAG